jgi:hypothetical protein
MAAARRLVFTFDEPSMDSLEQVKENGSFPTLGTAVRESIQLSETLQEQVANGFTEIVLRNPTTKQEKTIVVPSLRRVAKKAARTASSD